jgi:hypothetical protein
MSVAVPVLSSQYERLLAHRAPRGHMPVKFDLTAFRHKKFTELHHKIATEM